MSDQPPHVLSTTSTSSSPRQSTPHVAAPAVLQSTSGSVLSATASAGRPPPATPPILTSTSTPSRLTAEQTIHVSTAGNATNTNTITSTNTVPLFATAVNYNNNGNDGVYAASVAHASSSASGSAHGRGRRVLRANPIAIATNVTSNNGSSVVPVLVSSEEALVASAAHTRRPTLQAQTSTMNATAQLTSGRRSSKEAENMNNNNNNNTNTNTRAVQPVWVSEAHVAPVVPLTSHNLHALTASEQQQQKKKTTSSSNVVVVGGEGTGGVVGGGGGMRKEGSEARRGAESVTTRAAPAAAAAVAANNNINNNNTNTTKASSNAAAAAAGGGVTSPRASTSSARRVSNAAPSTSFLFAAEESGRRASATATQKTPFAASAPLLSSSQLPQQTQHHQPHTPSVSSATSLQTRPHSTRHGSAHGTNTNTTASKPDNWQRLRQEHEQRVRANEAREGGGAAAAAAQLPWWMSPSLQPVNTSAASPNVNPNNNTNGNAFGGRSTNTATGGGVSVTSEQARSLAEGSAKGSGLGSGTRRGSTHTNYNNNNNNKEGSVYDTGRVGQGNGGRQDVAYTFTVTEKKQSALPKLTASASSSPAAQGQGQQALYGSNDSVFMGARHAVSTNPLNIWQHEGAFLRNIFSSSSNNNNNTNNGGGKGANNEGRRTSSGVLTSLQSGGVRAAQNVSSAFGKTFSAMKGAATGLLMASETTATAHAAGSANTNTKRNGENMTSNGDGLSDIAVAEAVLLAQQQQQNSNAPVTTRAEVTQDNAVMAQGQEMGGGKDAAGLRRRTTNNNNNNNNSTTGGGGKGNAPPSSSFASSSHTGKGKKPHKGDDDGGDDEGLGEGAERKPALKVGTRTYRTRNLNALHAFSWDRRVFLPRTLGFGASAFQLFASPRFWEKLDWTVRASLLTILPTIILCLEPRSRRIFPLPTSVVALAFWITQPTFGGGLRELFIVLKGFSLSLIVIVIVVAINPKPPWLTLIFLFLSVLIVSFVAEETRRTCAYTLTALMMRYILYRDTTTFHYIGDYYMTLLIALGFGMAGFIVPYIRWASDIARHYITVMGDSVSLSTRGVCAGFWVHSSLERQLHVARLRQLQGTITRSAARARTGLSEMGYEPHTGRYTAQLKTRMAFLKRVADILEGTMHVIEQIANDPSIVDTPMCNAFGDRLLPELHRIGAAMDTTILRIVDLTHFVTEADMAAFREAHRRYDAAVDAVREEVILNNDDYHTDNSDILLGYFLFCIEELCQTVANFKEAAKPPNNVLYGLTFFVRDFNSLVTACITLVRAVWRRRTITRRLKEAIKLALCILVAALFQVYGLQNSDTSPVAGVDIIALVYNRTGGMSFQYANNRLLGTVLGSLTGLLSVQIANGRRWVLYIFVAMLSFVGSYVQTAPGYYPLGNAICNSVISIVLQYQNQNGAMVRIQQNCFAILIYFIVSSLVWPTRGRTKVRMALDISLRMFREAVFRLMHNLDLPEDAAAVSADVTLLIGEMNKRIGVQVSNLPGALVEPTMDSADFAEMPWNMMIMTQRKLAATLSMMQQAYTTFMSSKIGTGEDKTSLSVHWVALHRISPYMIELSDLIHAAVDIYLMTLSKATIVPTAHLTTIREGMLHCRKMILQTYIDTVQHEIAGEEGEGRGEDGRSEMDSRAGFSDSGFDYSQSNPRRGGGGGGGSSNPFGSTQSSHPHYKKTEDGEAKGGGLRNDSAFAPPTQVFQEEGGYTSNTNKGDATKQRPTSARNNNHAGSSNNNNNNSPHSRNSSFVVGQMRHSRKGGVLGYRLRPEEEELLRQFITTGSIMPSRAKVAEARIEHTMVDYSNNTPTNASAQGAQSGTLVQRNASSLLLSRPAPGGEMTPAAGHAQRNNTNNNSNNDVHAVVLPNASIVNASLTTANGTLGRHPMAASLVGGANHSLNSSRVAPAGADLPSARRTEALIGSDLFGVARPARGAALTNNTLSNVLPTPHHSFAGAANRSASNLVNNTTNTSTAGAVGTGGHAATTITAGAVPSLLATAQAAMTAEVNRLIGGDVADEMAEDGQGVADAMGIPRRGESQLLHQNMRRSATPNTNVGERGNEATGNAAAVRRERSGLIRSPSAEPHEHAATAAATTTNARTTSPPTNANSTTPQAAHEQTPQQPQSNAMHVDPATAHEAAMPGSAPQLITHVATSVPGLGDAHTTTTTTTTAMSQQGPQMMTSVPQRMTSSIFGEDARHAMTSLSASTTTAGTVNIATGVPQPPLQQQPTTMSEEHVHPSEPLYGDDDHSHTTVAATTAAAPDASSQAPHSWLPTEPLIDFATAHNNNANGEEVNALAATTTVMVEEEHTHHLNRDTDGGDETGLRGSLAQRSLFACDSNADILDEEGNPVRGPDEAAEAAARLAKEEVFECVSCYDAAQGVFVLTSRDIHSLEAFLFCVRALFMQIEEFEQHLLEMIHSNEMSKKL